MYKNRFKFEEVEVLNREVYRLHSLIQHVFIGSFLLSGTFLNAAELYTKICPHGSLHSRVGDL